METLADIKKTLRDKGIIFTEECSNSVSALTTGTSNGGMHIRLKLTVELNNGKLLGYCTGLGEQLIQVPVKDAMEAFFIRKSVHSSEWN